MIDFIVVFLIAAYSVFILFKIYKKKKSGGCVGCCGCDGKACHSCQRFDDSYIDELVKKAKEDKNG